MKVFLVGLLLICALSFSAARVETGSIICGDSDTWTMIGGASSTHKNAVRDVTFPKSYSTAPQVFLGISYIDSLNGPNLRFKFYLQNVTATGFRATCNTWSDTKIYQAMLNWISISGTDETPC